MLIGKITFRSTSKNIFPKVYKIKHYFLGEYKMGATSVTGVGKGSAYGNKGPHNGRDQFVSNLSPHVVAAGLAELTGTTLTVTFPTPLVGSKTKYAVLLTSAEASTTPAQVTTLTNNSDGDFASFEITNASGKDTFWMIVLKGSY